jgi:hypothetical protein
MTFLKPREFLAGGLLFVSDRGKHQELCGEPPLRKRSVTADKCSSTNLLLNN